MVKKALVTSRPFPFVFLALLLVSVPAAAGTYVNDLMTRYSSGNSLAEGSHNILFSDGISGIYYNPSRLVGLSYPSILTALSVKSNKMIFLNMVYGMPVKFLRASAFSVNLLYFNENNKNSLAPGLAFGTSLGVFEAGASASLHYNLEQAVGQRDFLFFKFGAAATIDIFKLGCVLENEIDETNKTLFLARFQAGATLLKNRVSLSAGIHQYLKKSSRVTVNVGCEVTPWKFITLGFNVEDWNPSFGFIFNSYPIKLCIAAWYHHAPLHEYRYFDYSLSLTFRR